MTSNRHHETGETLVEILITIIVIGITAIAAFYAISVGATSSKSHRDAATADALLRNEAEAAKQAARIDCTLTNPQPLTITYPSAIPNNFTVKATQPPPSVAPPTCPTVTGLSQVHITVTLPDQTTKTLDIDLRTT